MRRRPLGRQGARQGRRAARRTSSPGPTSRRVRPCSREGCWGHLTGAAIREFDLAEDREPAGLGARRQGGLEGPEAARPRDPHARPLAAQALGAKYGQLGGTWIYPMKDEKTGDDMVSIGFVVEPRLRRCHDLRITTCCRPSRHTARPRDPRGRRARRVGREGAPGRRLLVDAAALHARSRDRGRLRGHGRHDGASRASTTRSSPACSPRRPSTRRSEGSTDDSRPTSNAIEDSSVGRELCGGAQRPPAPAEGTARRRPDQQADDQSRRAGFRAGAEPGSATTTRRCSSATRKDRLPEAGRQATPSTSSPLSSSRATPRVTTRPTTSAYATASRARSPKRGCWMCPAGVYEIPDDAPAEGEVDVIVNYTNCVQCGAITAKGGQPDAARGRRRAPLPDHLNAPRRGESSAGCSC